MGTGFRVGAQANGDFRKWITRVAEVLSVGRSAEEAVRASPRPGDLTLQHLGHTSSTPPLPCHPQPHPHTCLFLTVHLVPFAIQMAARPFCTFLDTPLALTPPPTPPQPPVSGSVEMP